MGKKILFVLPSIWTKNTAYSLRFVPITPDGRLSAGDWMKTGKQLEEVQTKYAEAMAEFGLERG